MISNAKMRTQPLYLSFEGTSNSIEASWFGKDDIHMGLSIRIYGDEMS